MARCVLCGRSSGLFESFYVLDAEGSESFCESCFSLFGENARSMTSALTTSSQDVERYYSAAKEQLQRCPGSEAAQLALKKAHDRKMNAVQKEEQELRREQKAQLDADLSRQERQEAEQKRWDLEEKYRDPKFRLSLKDFLSTTGYSFEGYRITKYLGIQTGSVAMGTGFLSEYSADYSDSLGTESYGMGNKLREAQLHALQKLYASCAFDGANAVIGVDVDIMTLSNNLLVACATGTAVIVEKD